MISEDPRADNTDVYLFRSRQNPSNLVVLANYIPLEEPSSGPNFFTFSDGVRYAVHLDTTNDGRDDVSFFFSFRTRVQTPGTFLNYLGPITELTTDGRTTIGGGNLNKNYNRFQVYNITMVDRRPASSGSRVIARDVIVPPNNAGPTTIPDFAALTQQAIHSSLLAPGVTMRSFAGQVDDPFFIDLGGVFDLLRVRPFRSLHVLQPDDPRPNRPVAPDTISGFNCHTIALEIPITFLTATATIPPTDDPRRILGVYASASRPRVRVLELGGELTAGAMVQVSRLGQPLVNELFLPLADRNTSRNRNKDTWNMTLPQQDEQFREFFQFPEPALRLAQLYPALRGVVPNVSCNAAGDCFFTGPRSDLLGGATPLLNFVPDFLRVDVSVAPNPNPNRLGALGGDPQGFPNGRRLGDDVVDIYMRAAAGALVPGTITVNGQTTTRGAFLQSINFGDGVDRHENGRFGFLPTFPFARTAHPGVLPAHIGYDDPEKEPLMP